MLIVGVLKNKPEICNFSQFRRWRKWTKSNSFL